MDEKEFVKLCKKIVVNYFNGEYFNGKNIVILLGKVSEKHEDKTDNITITEDDVFVVWLCKTLQNNKALVSTTVNDGMYYEITHNGDKNETYVDVYKKWEKFIVK